ncbi:MAG TPA: 16S rRNA (cytosine(1402)-N(4))-methyltransferase RsmH [Acidobacteriota bacterium]|jgi:16S rRNA (cytosine1402-N4)-methyltransferase|nr:16S rRNA (cytosine(1402)-N(4))-methyltransferase RsmH [Acidobacteriota bacterium]
MSTAAQHEPVMLNEVLHYLACRRGGTYVDCTVGLGGHSEAVLRGIGPDGLLIGLDRDDHALKLAQERLTNGRRIKLFHENYKNLPLVLNNLHVSEVDGIFLDLGVSSLQLMSPHRGFSFTIEGPLDMRMDTTQKLTAADLVQQLSEKELADIFYNFGGEKKSRPIARRIVQQRAIEPITTTVQLARLIRSVISYARQKIHPATRVFQALRIAVNDELKGLKEFIHNAIGFLKAQGRMVVISFHSLEDRIVKTEFNLLSGKCICFRPAEQCSCPKKKVVRLLTRRPVQPTEEEVHRNPRSRSAKLRSVEKL